MLINLLKSNQVLYLKILDSSLFNFISKLRNGTIYQIRNKVFNFYKEILKDYPNGKVVDIGASIGNLSYFFLKMGYKVLSIEGSPKRFNILTKRFKYSKNFNSLNLIISDKKGDIDFFENLNNPGLSSIDKKWKDITETNFNYVNKIITLTSDTLDNILKPLNNVVYLKIDVEGAEELVLKTLNIPVPIISIESNLPYYFVETKRCLEKFNTLSENYKYNYAINYKLVDNNWMTYNEIIEKISHINISIDIFARIPKS
ncbi:MAG: FkbM family methyltransferase [Bacteroidetes bacterium]|nr:FkbM family methyltransferase [Bacteroidota bacterium]